SCAWTGLRRHPAAGFSALFAIGSGWAGRRIRAFCVSVDRLLGDGALLRLPRTGTGVRHLARSVVWAAAALLPLRPAVLFASLWLRVRAGDSVRVGFLGDGERVAVVAARRIDPDGRGGAARVSAGGRQQERFRPSTDGDFAAGP